MLPITDHSHYITIIFYFYKAHWRWIPNAVHTNLSPYSNRNSTNLCSDKYSSFMKNFNRITSLCEGRERCYAFWMPTTCLDNTTLLSHVSQNTLGNNNNNCHAAVVSTRLVTSFRCSKEFVGACRGESSSLTTINKRMALSRAFLIAVRTWLATWIRSIGTQRR